MKKYKTLSIVIPVYNESTYITRCLQNVIQTDLKGWKKEIIVIDDGSTDNSLKILEQFSRSVFKLHIIISSQNLGKGASLKKGIEKATGDIIIVQDADLEYDPNDYIVILKKYEEDSTYVVYGSRVLGSKLFHNYDANIFFLIGGLMLTRFVNFAFKTKITDQATCYKSWRTSLSKPLLDYCTGYGFEFEVEMTAYFAKNNVIHEVPIHYYPRTIEHGKKIRTIDFLKSLYMILVCKFKK